MTIEKLLERAPIAIIVIGAILFVLGAAGGLPIGNPPLTISDPTWRIALGLMGGFLVVIGLLLQREEKETRSEIWEDTEIQDKQEELAELNKKIISTLGEAIRSEKTVRNIDQRLYRKQLEQMTERIQTMENELLDKATNLRITSKRIAIAGIGSEIAVKIAAERGSENLDEATNAFSNAVGALVKEKELDHETFLKIFQLGFRSGPLPEDLTHKFLYFLSMQFRCAIQLSTALENAAAVVPVLIEEFDKNPDNSLQQILDSLGDRIRSGDLPGSD